MKGKLIGIVIVVLVVVAIVVGVSILYTDGSEKTRDGILVSTGMKL